MLSVKNEHITILPEQKTAMEAYLAGAVKLMGGMKKSEAGKAAADYAEKADKKNLTVDHIAAEYDKQAHAAAKYGWRARVNYASDADVAGIDDAVKLGVAGVVASSLAPIAAADPQILSATLAVAAVAYTAGSLAKNTAAIVSASNTPEQKKNAVEYADIKHAQLALKQLKRAIEAPIKAAEKEKDKALVNRCFAAGMGNPGGMITTFKSEGR